MAMLSEDELLARFPSYDLDRDNAAHYRGRLDRKLLINRCASCGYWRHPPKPVCPRCWSNDLRPTEVAGTGTIHLLILLHQGPPVVGVDYSTPYPVATIELDEQPGLRFTSTVIGAPNDQIAVGKRVQLDWIDRGGAPLPVFRLTGEGRA